MKKMFLEFWNNIWKKKKVTKEIDMEAVEQIHINRSLELLGEIDKVIVSETDDETLRQLESLDTSTPEPLELKSWEIKETEAPKIKGDGIINDNDTLDFIRQQTKKRYES